MILIEKEWQDYKDSKTLYKLKVLALFVLLVNIGWHVYKFTFSALQSGVSLNFIYIEEISISWSDILLFFNMTSLYFFLPVVILSNVGAVSKTKMKNSHFFATGVSREAMGAVKIALSVFIPVIVYAFTSIVVCMIANFFFPNSPMVINNTNISLSLTELYVRPLVQVPFMLMCISIALLAEQVGKDKLISIFFFFCGFLILFAVLGLSSVMRDGILEVLDYVFFNTSTLNVQKFILGELLFSCVFMIAFTLSVLRYAKEAKI